MYFNRKINLLRKGLLKEEPLANKSFLIKAVIVLLLALFLNLVHADSIPTELSQTDSIPTELSQTDSIPTELSQTDSIPTELSQTDSIPTELSQTDSIPTELSQTDSISKELSQAEKSIGQLINRNFSTGTGFFISEKHFVTNLHVILAGHAISSADLIDESAFYIQQKESFGFLKVKKVLHISAIYDFALLEVETEVSNYLKLGELEKQEELHVFGYPGREFKRMIKKKEYPIRLEGFTYSFPVNHSDLPGASGSPVLNNQGEVVGLLSEGEGNLTMAIQPDILKDLIEGNLGSSCLDFIDIKSCINEEVKNLKNKSEQGHVLAQYKLGQEYLREYLAGKETEKSKEKAFYWYQESAKQAYAPAQSVLAGMYYKGIVIEDNKEKAFYWYQESAEQGYAPAQFELASLYYEEGLIEKAFYWYQESAKQGYAPAQFELAFMYHKGEVIEESKGEAIYWAQTSAKQGNAQAQYLLADTAFLSKPESLN